VAAENDESLRRRYVEISADIAMNIQVAQAQGVLMARHGVGVDAAMHLLAAIARDRGERVIDVAQQIISDAGWPAAGVASLPGRYA
jgi:AmiR/NasT family two-component response regulator